MQALLSGNRDEFARALGYADYEALMLASEVVAVEGDVSWYITRLPDGRWAAWDDAREEALADQWDGWTASHEGEEETERVRWLVERPASPHEA